MKKYIIVNININILICLICNYIWYKYVLGNFLDIIVEFFIFVIFWIDSNIKYGIVFGVGSGGFFVGIILILLIFICKCKRC